MVYREVTRLGFNFFLKHGGGGSAGKETGGKGLTLPLPANPFKIIPFPHFSSSETQMHVHLLNHLI